MVSYEFDYEGNLVEVVKDIPTTVQSNTLPVLKDGKYVLGERRTVDPNVLDPWNPLEFEGRVVPAYEVLNALSARSHQLHHSKRWTREALGEVLWAIYMEHRPKNANYHDKRRVRRSMGLQASDAYRSRARQTEALDLEQPTQVKTSSVSTAVKVAVGISLAAAAYKFGTTPEEKARVNEAVKTGVQRAKNVAQEQVRRTRAWWEETTDPERVVYCKRLVFDIVADRTFTTVQEAKQLMTECRHEWRPAVYNEYWEMLDSISRNRVAALEAKALTQSLSRGSVVPFYHKQCQWRWTRKHTNQLKHAAVYAFDCVMNVLVFGGILIAIGYPCYKVVTWVLAIYGLLMGVMA